MAECTCNLIGIEETDTRLTMTFNAALTCIDAVCAKLRGFLESRGVACHEFEIVLITREALINAVVHGCKLAPGKRVEFEAELSNGEIVLRVADQGAGFDWRNKGFTLPPQDWRHGRGMYIMREYATDIQYNDDGNVLTIRKSLQSGGSSMTHVENEGDLAVVKPGCDIVASNVDALRAEILSVLGQGAARLAIDMAGVEMIDSVGIGLLIATHNSLAKKNAALELRGVSADIQNLLRTMRLERHFTIVK